MRLCMKHQLQLYDALCSLSKHLFVWATLYVLSHSSFHDRNQILLLKCQGGMLIQDNIFYVLLFEKEKLIDVVRSDPESNKSNEERNRHMTQHQDDLQEQVMARAMKDEVFRQDLLSNPSATLERELGLTLPPNMTIQVHENTPTAVHLVLPLLPVAGELRELSDDELEAVVGGANYSHCNSGHSGHCSSGHSRPLLVVQWQ